jgi:hypothetical protein
VSINYQTGLTVNVAQENICGFTSDTGQCDEVFQAPRNVSIESLQYGARSRLERAGLLPEEARRYDHALNLRQRRRGHRSDVGETPEEFRGHTIYAFVSALGRKNGRDQTLPWRLKIETDARLRV